MNNYEELIVSGKFDEADELRKESIPAKLYKYFVLYDEKENKILEENEKRFVSLETNKIWFSKVKGFNDPYELRTLFYDFPDELENQGMKDALGFLKYFLQTILETVEIVCLSSLGPENVPMWAYYANNHHGFCVEYEVIDKEKIYPVLMSSRRIDLYELFGIVNKISDDKIRNKYLDKFFSMQLYSKHESWQHEQEYRIFQYTSNRADLGENISLDDVGLIAHTIFSGISCSEENKKRLNDISLQIGCGALKQIMVSPDTYFRVKEYSGEDCNQSGVERIAPG